MKKLTQNILFVITISLFSIFVQAQTCENPPAPKDGQSVVKLSDLDYVGKSIIGIDASVAGKCSVITNVRTDQQARLKCPAGSYLINPGNPQYGQQKRGSLDTNTLYYYFCISNTAQLKETMCSSRKADLESSLNLIVKWDPKRSQDGDCVCKKTEESTASFKICSDPEAIAEANNCNDPILESRNGACYCKSGQGFSNTNDPVKKADECVKEVAAVNADFQKCLGDLQKEVEQCTTVAKSALSKCSKDAPEQHDNIAKAQSVLDDALGFIVAKNANTGALEMCQKISLGGSALVNSLSLMKDNCSKELKECESSCKKVKDAVEERQAYYNACKQDIAETKGVAPEKLESSAKFNTAFNEAFLQITSASEDGDKFCRTNVKKEKGVIDGFLNDLDKSVRQADICRCQLTAGAGSSDECNAILGPSMCALNPSQPGCQFTMVSCATTGTCKTGAIGNNSSGLAAPNFGTVTGGGFSSGSDGQVNPANVSISGSDLSGLNEPVSGAAKTADTSGGGSLFGAGGGAGGGAGFGGGGGGSGSSSGDGSGEAGEKKGLAGFFNAAKSGLSGLFGGIGKSGDGKTASRMKDKNFKDDVNKMRPKNLIRGLANNNDGYGIGGKNRDIWKTMNQRYYDQYHTFITVEQPSK